MGWRIEQAEEFRQQVEEFTGAERAILAEVYRALLRHGPLPHPGSPLAIHRLRDPRAGDAYVVVLPRIVLGYQVLGEVIVRRQPTSSAPEHVLRHAWLHQRPIGVQRLDRTLRLLALTRHKPEKSPAIWPDHAAKLTRILRRLMP